MYITRWQVKTKYKYKENKRRGGNKRREFCCSSRRKSVAGSVVHLSSRADCGGGSRGRYGKRERCGPVVGTGVHPKVITSVMVVVVVLARASSLPASFRDDAPDDGEAATMMPLVSLLPSWSIGPIFLLVCSPSCQIAHAQLTLFLSLFQSQPTKYLFFSIQYRRLRLFN